MATILEFRLSDRGYHAADAGARGGHMRPAEIVFFPGVRYERWDETPPSKPTRGKSRRRDRMELGD
ncbi:MAG: hypothetical protein ACRCS9_14120 [Hyphomicrobium sp.]